jgi:hypothetical protein
LARAQARSGDPVAIATYLGTKDRFDRAITDFAERYECPDQEVLANGLTVWTMKAAGSPRP